MRSQNAESFCQLESLDGSFPVVESPIIHFVYYWE